MLFMKSPDIFRHYVLSILILVIAVFLTAAYPLTAFGQDADPDPAGPDRVKQNPAGALKERVLSYFYPVKGTVVSVDNDRVTVGIRTETEMIPGMRYHVFREGKQFYHPVTHEPIGRSESLTGRIEIIKMLKEESVSRKDETLYLCRTVTGEPEAGDIVRLTSSSVNLAFFQDKTTDWTLSELFYNALKDSGRFHLLESYAPSYDPGELSRLAKDLGAEALLFFSTPTKGNTLFLNVKLFWPESGTAFAEIEEPVGPDVIHELTEQERLVSLGEIEGEPWGTHRLEYGELITMGDVDGDNRQELVMSDGNTIRIYRYDEQPRNLGYFKDDPRKYHLHVDVMDLNGNGRAEIFVTSLVNYQFSSDISDSTTPRKKTRNKIVSSVFEYDQSAGYRKIQDNVPYAMRVIGSNLLLQKFSPRKTFTGPVLKGVWSDGRYMTGESIQLPAGINIYGFTYVDWENNGQEHILSFDDNGNLVLFSGSEIIWKSSGSLGVFEKSFVKQDSSTVQTEERWVVRGRLIPMKTPEGQEVIVIQKVPFVKRVPGIGYRKAEVYSLRWDGDTMVQKQVLGGIRGTVTDYLVHGSELFLLTKPSLAMLLNNSLSGDFERGSVLYYYKLEEK
jgi:hypothetical protein